MDLQQIETALKAEVIYNVDYVELKSRLNRLIEKAHSAANTTFLATGGRDGGAFLTDAYYGFPMAHTLKAFAKKLPAPVEGEFRLALEAYRAIVTTFTPAADLLAAAKGRVVKARKPAVGGRKTPERTLDNTGTCSCCGMNVKLSGGRIVKHGFTIRWGYQSGSCFGVGYLPIEVSPEGIVATIEAAERALSRSRIALEYDCLDRKARAHHLGTVSSMGRIIKDATARLAAWAPRPLPKAK
jgi:hypothetical protein